MIIRIFQLIWIRNVCILAPSKENKSKRELILVLEGDLYLVPFPVLRSSQDNAEYLCERFSLLVVPNLTTLKTSRSRTSDSDKSVRSLIVGNPKLPNAVTEHWGWRDIPQAEQEATMVAELLQANGLTGNQATKEQVLNHIQEAECVHFATHVSWKLSSIVLSPAEVLEQSPTKRLYITDNVEEEDNNEASTTAELPPLSEFLLSAADLLSLQLTAKLVVVSRRNFVLDISFNDVETDQLIAHERPTGLGDIRWIGGPGEGVANGRGASSVDISMACTRNCYQDTPTSVLLSFAARNKSCKVRLMK